MRDRAGCTGQCCYAFGLDSLLLQREQLATNLSEGSTEFPQFGASPWVDGVGEIAPGKRLDACDKIVERACNGASHESKQHDAKQNGQPADQINGGIQMLDKCVYRHERHHP